MAGHQRSSRDDSGSCPSADLPPAKKLLTGLIGAPIAHSASPAMHERAAEALGLRGHYQLIEVAGADAAGLRMMLEGVRRLGFAGVNVTFPYKEAVVPLLDELAPGAAAMGAVNTVVVKDGRLIGHNTDTTGFARAVAPLLGAVRKCGRRDRRRRRRQGDRLCAGEPERGRPPHLRQRAGAGREARRAAGQAWWRAGWPTASRTRSTARPASSTARRSACCRTGTRRSRRRCCTRTCGSRMPSIRR